MENISKILLYLMACSIQSIKPEDKVLVGADLEKLLQTAKAHSVSAMVCMALEQTDTFRNAEESTRLKWIDAKNKAVRKNLLLDTERHQLEKEFAKNGIWYMPLKGSILKDWYPKFGMREMADNDILFDEKKRNDVKQIFQNRGYTVESYGKINHDAYEKPPIYNFEMHVELYLELYEKFHEKYINVKQRLIQDEYNPYRFNFTQEDFYVFAITHAYKHYHSRGTGVRTLADIYVMEQKLGKTLNWEYVESELRDLDIFDYEKESRQLAKKLFGAAVWSQEDLLTEAEQKMLAYYVGSSTYGTIQNKMQNLQSDGKAITVYTKLRYIFSRIFPDLKWCKFYAPTVYKYPVLLPFFWDWRLLVKGFKKRNIVKCELESIKNAK